VFFTPTHGSKPTFLRLEDKEEEPEAENDGSESWGLMDDKRLRFDVSSRKHRTLDGLSVLVLSTGVSLLLSSRWAKLVSRTGAENLRVRGI
jgi:hypothetical protein